MTPRGWDASPPKLYGVSMEQTVAGAIERWGHIEQLSRRARIQCCEPKIKRGCACPYVAKWRLQGRDYCNWHVPVGGWVARAMLARQVAAVHDAIARGES